MLILGVHSGIHDGGACLFDEYRLLSAISQERMTRVKSDGGRMPAESFDECLKIAGRQRTDVDAIVFARGIFPSRYYTHLRGGRLAESYVRRLLGTEKQKFMANEGVRYKRVDSAAMFDGPRFCREFEFRRGIEVAFCNHHFAHALPCLFHNDWQEALLYTADGGGDNVNYSMRIFQDGKLTELYGGDAQMLQPRRIDSLGQAYGFVTEALGFIAGRHEGKVTGLAAFGKPKLYDSLASHFRVDEQGHIRSDFADDHAMREYIFQLSKGSAREDVAASIQLLLENVVLEATRRILARHPVRHLGVSGGVFANVRLNQRLAEELPIDDIFVYPAMSDQGLPCGGVLQFLLERDGIDSWLSQRWPLDTLYYGRDFGAAIDVRLENDSAFRKHASTPVEATAQLLQQGRIVAIHTRGMEYGPRALGARSIMAAPVDARINQVLNERLSRTEFMPFAPVVAAEDADEVFDLGAAKRDAARFMTITCRVREAWHGRIPAVVHVDGTARPQIIERHQNPLYFDILAAYKALTGVPVLINTSFNAHEEPIINSPDETARALADRRIDFVVTENAVYGLADDGVKS